MAGLKEILSWFEKNKYPTQEQFKESWTSFWHKSEKMPMEQVVGLQDELSDKALKSDLNAVETELKDKASKEELANVVAGLVPMGSVANLTELEVKPKRNNDAYYVEDQLSPEGDAYIYRWDDGLSQWVNTKQVVFGKDVAFLVNNFLSSDSNLINYPHGSILEFQIKETADVNYGNEYYISKLINRLHSSPEGARFLIQITDKQDKLIAQKYLSDQSLNGIQWIDIVNASNGLLFARAYINADLFPLQTTSFNKCLHLRLPVKNSTVTPSFIFPGGQIKVTFDAAYNGEVTIEIPSSSRIVHLGYNYITTFPVILKEKLNEPVYLLFDKIEKRFFLQKVNNYLNNYQDNVLLGLLNRFGQQQIIYTSSYSVNGVSQSYLAPPIIPNYISRDDIASQKMAIINANIGSIFKSEIDFNVSFPIDAIKDIKVLQCNNTEIFKNNDGSFKELYFVYFRKKGVVQNKTSIIQIGENIDDIVGVNKNVFISYSSDKDLSSLATIILSNHQLKISLTIDWTYITKESYSLKKQLPINTEILYNQSLGLSFISHNKPLKGEHIIHFGDSVMQFGNTPQLIGLKTGAFVENCAIGGTRMSKRSGESEIVLAWQKLDMASLIDAIIDSDYTVVDEAVKYIIEKENRGYLVDIINRIKSVPWDKVTGVIFSFGTNDFAVGTKLGEGLDQSTFIGSINYIVDKILSKYPHVKIYFTTPTHRYFDKNLDSDLHCNKNGLYLKDYVDAIMNSAALQHLPSLDLYSNSGLNKYNHSTFFADSVHPNNAGFEHLSSVISAWLSSLWLA